MRIAVNQLGLAAYIRMHKVPLLAVEGKTFVFDSEKTVSEWRVAYNNSCCMAHDTLVCELRHFLKSSI